MAPTHNALRNATRHHYHSMRPFPLSPRSCQTATTTTTTTTVQLDPSDFDARVSAWEKNEAREASIMSSAPPPPLTYPPTPSFSSDDSQVVSHSRSSHFSTIETTPHHIPHLHHHHHSTVQVWHPNPSPHTHRSSLDPRYPFVEILPNPEPTPRLHHSSFRTPRSNRGGNTRGWVAPGGNPVTTTPKPSPIPASQGGPASSTLTPLLSPLSVAQGNDTTRLHYDLRTPPVNVRLSARDPTTEGAPERYLPRSNVRRLIQKKAFHPSLSSIDIVSSLFPWVITVEAGHSGPILIDDVLSAIHATLHQPVTHEEWDQLPQAQQQRITSVWEDALALSESGTPPPEAGASSPWYTRLISCCKSKYRRHPNEDGILPPRAAHGCDEKGDERSIVLRKRVHREGVLRIDWVCGKTRWGGLVKDDGIARRRGVPQERWERTWCLVLE